MNSNENNFESNDMNIDKSEWYYKTKEHWENSDSTIKGVLGGNEDVHITDVKTSCELLEGLIKTNKISSLRVIDCGAGIGRVTSSVLLNYFQECDILEQDEKYIEFCKNEFKDNPKVSNIYRSSLQDFKFEKEYNVIWLQWCLENLDDYDLTNFMLKCNAGLAKNGLIIVKENVVNKGAQFINADYSRVRSDTIFLKIFQSSGLKILRHFHHPNWPKDYMKVSVFVLKF
jgi:protein N-terminal methyltransferase